MAAARVVPFAVHFKGAYTLVTLPRTVTLQETNKIRSYELNFHPVPHGVTVSCERYTLAFAVCYGSSGRW